MIGWMVVIVGGVVIACQAPGFAQRPKDRPAQGERKPDVAPRFGERPRFGEERFAPPGLPELVSPEQAEQLLDFLREHFPQRYRKLRRLRERNPDAFRRQMIQIAPRVLELLLRMRENPELGELLIQQQRLEEELHAGLEDYRFAEEHAERDQLRARLEEVVSRLVETRLQRRGLEIEALERRLDEQRRRLEEDRDNRDRIVAEELETLLIRHSPRERPRRSERKPL